MLNEDISAPHSARRRAQHWVVKEWYGAITIAQMPDRGAFLFSIHSSRKKMFIGRNLLCGQDQTWYAGFLTGLINDFQVKIRGLRIRTSEIEAGPNV